MPEVSALLLALDVHQNSQGLADIQGVVTAVEWDSAAEPPPDHLPRVLVFALVHFDAGEIPGVWESRFEWWQDGTSLVYFERPPVEVPENFFIVAVRRWLLPTVHET